MINWISNATSSQKAIYEIMDPSYNWGSLSPTQAKALAYKKLMYPTVCNFTYETYSRDAERMANYELESLTLVNAKGKAEYTWEYLNLEYAINLLNFLGFKSNFKNGDGDIVPEDAPELTLNCIALDSMSKEMEVYLGQTIEGELAQIEVDGVTRTVIKQFRIALIER